MCLASYDRITSGTSGRLTRTVLQYPLYRPLRSIRQDVHSREPRRQRRSWEDEERCLDRSHQYAALVRHGHLRNGIVLLLPGTQIVTYWQSHCVSNGRYQRLRGVPWFRCSRNGNGSGQPWARNEVGHYHYSFMARR